MLIRNAGGAVATVVVLLFIAPGTIAQLASSAGEWMPAALSAVIAGIGTGPAVPAALVAMVAWGAVAVVLSAAVVRRRDVV
ncbi:hypothetical protein [Euzebya sp.]|uniref:hypothetical protein n=1 Tax=Euzebya sp. TaxID=1971409 RepID=UPI00351639A5